MPLTSQTSAVAVTCDTLVIPSAPVQPGRLPLVVRAGSESGLMGTATLPYRMLQEIQFGKFQPREFTAVTLENEFLKLVVLPELGGRLHRALYKPANYDLFYYNDAIRAELISHRGAWYAGGAEFNFPFSHSMTTHAGVEYTTQRWPDGSAGIVVSNTDLPTQMRWEATIRLAPGSLAIEFFVRLINRTAWPQRFWYWLNAAVPQGPQIRYHFAATKAIGHMVDIDGPQTMLDTYPHLRSGYDARIPSKLMESTSVFLLDNQSGFFGYYDVDADVGLVRSAPIRNTPGNKIWSWGADDYGCRFNERLVPPGQQHYGELQSGRPESQTDFGVMEPFEIVDCRETWYPIPKLGGMTDGSAELAMLAEPAAGGAGSLKVRLVANRSFDELLVRAEPAGSAGATCCQAGVKPLAEKTLKAVRAGEPVELSLPATREPVRIRVTDRTGRIVLEYRNPPSQPDALVTELYESKVLRKPDRTPQALTVQAAACYRGGDPAGAENCCRAALELDDQFGPAHRWLGLLLHLQGRRAEAAAEFRAAVLNDPMDYAAYYYFAANAAEAGPEGLDKALLELNRTIGYTQGQYRPWAATLLARGLLAAGRVDDARRLLSEWPGEVAVGPLGRLAYRLGLATPADSPWWNPVADLFVQVVEAAKVADALDAWWKANVKAADEAAGAVMDVVEELLDAGDVDRARATLAWLAGHATLGAVCPLAHYRLGELAGDLASAARNAAKKTDRAAMAWPGWAVHEPLLEKVVTAAPNDALAAALLGLMRLRLGRAGDAIAPLEAACRLDPADALSWRNLGLARWSAGQPWQACQEAYRKATDLWPDYLPLVIENDRMLLDRKAPLEERRGLLYDRLPASLKNHEDIATRRADLALRAGRLEEGLAELSGKEFYPGEGRFDTHRLFVRMSIQLGERLANQGDWHGALARWRESMTYPKNFNIGKPSHVQESRSRFLVALALEKLGDAKAAAAELETLLPICQRTFPFEAYFGVLALRKLGRSVDADQWVEQMEKQVAQRAKLLMPGSNYWSKLTVAFLERVRGNLAKSNELIAALNPMPGEDLADMLVSKLY